MLRRVSDDEFWAKITAIGTVDEWNFGEFLCHTQTFESFEKLVTEASKKVFSTKNQDGFIRSALSSRASMPKFTKNCRINLPLEK